MSFLRKFKPGARIRHFWATMVVIMMIGALERSPVMLGRSLRL